MSQGNTLYDELTAYDESEFFDSTSQSPEEPSIDPQDDLSARFASDEFGDVVPSGPQRVERPLGMVGGIPSGSIGEEVEESKSDASDVITAGWLNTFAGRVLNPDLDEDYLRKLDAQVEDSFQRRGMLKTLGLTFVGLGPAELPFDIVAGKGVGTFRNLVRMGRLASAAATKPGLITRAAKFTARETLEGALALTASELAQVKLTDKKFNANQFQTQAAAEILLSAPFAGAIRVGGITVKALKKKVKKKFPDITDEQAEQIAEQAVENSDSMYNAERLSEGTTTAFDDAEFQEPREFDIDVDQEVRPTQPSVPDDDRLAGLELIEEVGQDTDPVDVLGDLEARTAITQPPRRVDADNILSDDTIARAQLDAESRLNEGMVDENPVITRAKAESADIMAKNDVLPETRALGGELDANARNYALAVEETLNSSSFAKLMDNAVGFTGASKDMLSIMRARSLAAGVSMDKWIADHIADVRISDIGAYDSSVKFMEDGRSILEIGRKGWDADSQKDMEALGVEMFHEFSHIARSDLDNVARRTAESHYGVEDGKWTASQEEAFANDFVRWATSGNAPTGSGLKAVFSKIRNWFKSLFNSNMKDHMHPEMKKVFDDLMTPTEPHIASKTIDTVDDIGFGRGRNWLVDGLANRSVDKLGFSEIGDVTSRDLVSSNGQALPDVRANFKERVAKSQEKTFNEANDIANKAAEAIEKSDLGDMSEGTKNFLYGKSSIANMADQSSMWKDIGYDEMNDILRQGEYDADAAFKHLHMNMKSNANKHGYTAETDDLMNSSDIQNVKLPSQVANVTNAQLVSMKMNALDDMSYKNIDNPDPKKRVSDNGYGLTSNAEAMVRFPFELGDGKSIDLTKADVDALISMDLGELDPAVGYLRDSIDEVGKIQDLGMIRTGFNPITDSTNKRYYPRKNSQDSKFRKETADLDTRAEEAKHLKERKGSSPIKYVHPLKVLADLQSSAVETYGKMRTDLIVRSVIDGKPMSTGKLKLDGPGAETKRVGADRKKMVKKKDKKTGKEIEVEKDYKKPLKDVIKDTHGSVGRKMANTLIDRIQEENTFVRAGDMSKLSSFSIKSLARMALSGNFVVAATQPASLPLIGKHLAGGAKAVADATQELYSGNPNRFKDEMMQYDPYMYRRLSGGQMSSDTSEIIGNPKFMDAVKSIGGRKGIKGKAGAVGKLYDSLFAPIRYVDDSTMNVIWLAAKKELGLDDLSKASPEKIRDLNKLAYKMVETQQNDIKRLKSGPQLSSDPLTRGLTIFSSAANRAFQQARESMVTFAKSDKGTEAQKQLIMGVMPVIVSSVAFTAIGTAGLEAKRRLFNTEEERKAMEKAYSLTDSAMSRVLNSSVGLIPLYGQVGSGVITSAFGGRAFDIDVPILSMANEIIGSVGNLTSLEADKTVRGLGKMFRASGASRFLQMPAEDALVRILTGK